ncbi:MAG TPA: carboxypeptidase-like regulatory domain-containing protein, partial [Terriglobia bacterium]|nr:carboxypeptidase-like regulatory domain-containing protein [Terriglobia bacterium]
MYSKRMHKARGVPRTFLGLGRGWVLIPLFLFCLLGFVNSPAWAQGFVGSVTGVVTDPTGAVVPGANVTLTDTTKGYTHRATTDGVGRYVIRQLPPSTYQLKVEAQGFKTSIQEGIVLAVAQASSVDVALELGTTAQSVEVVSASPVLSTQDAAIGQDISRTFINDLPLVGRNVFNLALLAPGVSQAPNRTYGGSGSDYPTNFVSNGSRNATAEILIDGVTTTTAEPNTGINASLYEPSVDAVQEFKMEQGNLSAEVGSSSNTYI